MQPTLLRVALSQTQPGKDWIEQFATQDQLTAAKLLDSIVSLDDDLIINSLLAQLEHIARTPRCMPRPIALYAEREVQERSMFDVEETEDTSGAQRSRAIGRQAGQPVNPVRGNTRVGSEGLIATLISRAQKAHGRVFMNHPGPDRIRERKARSIVIVTDFIGTGDRLMKMLDKFWRRCQLEG